MSEPSGLGFATLDVITDQPFAGNPLAAVMNSACLYRPGVVIPARMFSPTAGIPEDSATGSAAALLSARLLENGALVDGETRLTIRQGVEMGRPSAIGLRIPVRDGALGAVHVSGGAVPVSSGRIRIP